MALAGASVCQAATYTADLQKLYVEFYGRPADPTGLNYWESVVESAVASGGTAENVLTSIANNFASSVEFTSTMTGLTDAQKITKIYTTLFSHDPDPSGLLYWSGQLSSGSLTLGQIVRTIGESALTAGNTDGVALQNKITAATAFTDAVDTTPEILGYSGVAAGNLAKAWLATVTDNSSRDAALAPVALAATVASVTAGGSGSAPTDIALSSASVADNAGANATVGTLTATDSDAGATHTFSFVTGTGDTDNGAFNLSGNTLRLTANANYVAQSSYSIRLQATDNGGLTFAKTFTVTVTAPVNPTIVSVGVPEGGTVGGSQNLNFTVNYSEGVIVTGTPQLSLTIGGAQRTATYASFNQDTSAYLQ